MSFQRVLGCLQNIYMKMNFASPEDITYIVYKYGFNRRLQRCDGGKKIIEQSEDLNVYGLSAAESWGLDIFEI